ncbi:acetylglutamate kinase [Streptacidiphilus fuscans]
MTPPVVVAPELTDAQVGRVARFVGEIVVVKFGGNAMVDERLNRAFAQDVVRLRQAGVLPVVVHGGGPQIDAQLARFGMRPSFAAGLRVTTPEVMEVVRMVLAGQVQRQVVGLLNEYGPFAVGLTGEDAWTMTATKRYAEVDGERVELGLVGDVSGADPSALHALLRDGRIPVVSPIARSEDGLTYNVNADAGAAALAVALRAQLLVVLTDVAGLFADWPSTEKVVDRITADELERLLPTLSGGMIPKMEGCLRAVRSGVPVAHVLDGRAPHALFDHAFGDTAVGTRVVP